MSYVSLKQAAREFNEAKQMMISMLLNAKLGRWVKKPPEQDCFDLVVDAAISTNTTDDLHSDSMLDYHCLSEPTTGSANEIIETLRRLKREKN